jgi:hypothetical protein
LGDPGIYGVIILIWNLKKEAMRVLSGCVWLRIGTTGGFL